MAEKGFGVKEVNLIGASGTPTITSPNNLNLNANNVAISTNVSIGGTLSVTGNVSVGGTLTYEDVTNIDSVGVVTARSGLSVTGGTSFFAGAISAAGGITGTATTATNITVTANNTANETVYPLFSDGASGSQGAETDTGLTYNPNTNLFTAGSFSGGGANLTSLPAGQLTGTVADARISTLTASKLSGALPAISGANLTNLNGSNIASGTVADARISTLTASKLSGALPAISAASLTNIPEPDEAPVVDFSVTANGSSAYRFSGGGVDSTADDPNLYLIRGQKYRFNNTTGSAHPFQFRATTGGSAYTAGVSGDQNGVQFFTPDYDAPSKIYYICTLHSNMVGTIYIRGASGANEDVGITTFSGQVHLNQLKKASGTLDYLAAIHNFANAAGSTNYFTVNSTDATIYGTSDGVLNLTTTDSRGSFIRFQENGTSKAWVGCSEGLGQGDQDDLGLVAVDKIRFRSNNAQRLVIDSNKVMHGDSNVLAGGLDDVRIRNSASYRGLVLRGTGGSGGMANYNEYCFLFNRMGSDGDIITFNAQGSQEGSISVSGSSVSYNGGVLSRWSQLVGISTNNKADRPTIYQGTVMSNLDEMCEWPGEENMQLNKTQVSTASGDKNVAGVFWAWHDDDDTYVNDFYVAQTGDYIIRVGAATTVTRGDLLESAGDGTAKPQSDDIVRSKTVAKVTSGIAHTTYPDGTKTYPCVLMGS